MRCMGTFVLATFVKRSRGIRWYQIKVFMPLDQLYDCFNNVIMGPYTSNTCGASPLQSHLSWVTDCPSDRLRVPNNLILSDDFGPWHRLQLNKQNATITTSALLSQSTFLGLQIVLRTPVFCWTSSCGMPAKSSPASASTNWAKIGVQQWTGKDAVISRLIVMWALTIVLCTMSGLRVLIILNYWNIHDSDDDNNLNSTKQLHLS